MIELLLAATSLCLTFLVPIILLIWSRHLVKRRAAHLDSVFLPLGLEGRSHAFFWRRYRGKVGGRQVEVRTYYGSYFWFKKQELWVDVSMKAPMWPGATFVKPVSVTHLDRDWVSELASTASVEASIRRLLEESNSDERRGLFFNSDALMLRLCNTRLEYITPDSALLWLESMRLVQDRAVTLPPPTVIPPAQDILSPPLEALEVLIDWVDSIARGRL